MFGQLKQDGPGVKVYGNCFKGKKYIQRSLNLKGRAHQQEPGFQSCFQGRISQRGASTEDMVCENCRVQRQKGSQGDHQKHLDITKIKHKKAREIALIRRYTRPRVNTMNEQLLRRTVEAKGGVTEQDWSKRINHSTIVESGMDGSANRNHKILTQNNTFRSRQSNRGRNIRHLLNQSAAGFSGSAKGGPTLSMAETSQLETKSFVSPRPQTQGATSGLTGSIEQQIERRINQSNLNSQNFANDKQLKYNNPQRSTIQYLNPEFSTINPYYLQNEKMKQFNGDIFKNEVEQLSINKQFLQKHTNMTDFTPQALVQQYGMPSNLLHRHDDSIFSQDNASNMEQLKSKRFKGYDTCVVQQKPSQINNLQNSQNLTSLQYVQTGTRNSEYVSSSAAAPLSDQFKTCSSQAPKSLGTLKYFQSKQCGIIMRNALHNQQKALNKDSAILTSQMILDGRNNQSTLSHKMRDEKNRKKMKIDSFLVESDAKVVLKALKDKNIEDNFKRKIARGFQKVSKQAKEVGTPGSPVFYNHYQRPMSQALERVSQGNKSLVVAQSGIGAGFMGVKQLNEPSKQLNNDSRMQEQSINEVILQPNVCSISLIDKFDQYEAMLERARESGQDHQCPVKLLYMTSDQISSQRNMGVNTVPDGQSHLNSSLIQESRQMKRKSKVHDVGVGSPINSHLIIKTEKPFCMDKNMTTEPNSANTVVKDLKQQPKRQQINIPAANNAHDGITHHKNPNWHTFKEIEGTETTEYQ